MYLIHRFFVVTFAAFLCSAAFAQPSTRPTEAPVSPIVTRMMKFDANGDGKVSRDELTDERLTDLFNRADTDKDASVTKEEWSALAAKFQSEAPEGRGQGGPGGPGGFGGGDRRGPGGPGGRGPGGGGFGGP